MEIKTDGSLAAYMQQLLTLSNSSHWFTYEVVYKTSIDTVRNVTVAPGVNVQVRVMAPCVSTTWNGVLSDFNSA